MADLPSILESLAAGILSGGSAVLTTVLGVFRDLRNRLKAVEEAVGAPATSTSGSSGLYLAVANLSDRIDRSEEAIKKLQKSLEELEDEPPDWVVRMVARSRTSTSVNLEVQQEFENRIEGRLRTVQDRLTRELDDVKKDFDGVKKSMRELEDQCILKDAYLQDSRRRADELSTIKENLAAANGLLRGVLGALGLIGPDNNGRR